MIVAIALAAFLHPTNALQAQYVGPTAAAEYQSHLSHIEHEQHETDLRIQRALQAAIQKQEAEAAREAAAQPVAPPAPRPEPPKPQAPVQASNPQPAPAGSAFQTCVEFRESSDNPDASNGTHWGLFQFSPTLWALGGGNPAQYGSAPAGIQIQVFQHIMADDINGGASNWAPYDGC
jgi:hypothetical protein